MPPAGTTLKTARPALDALIEAAEAAPGFLGGKLSGAGWAGCTVNLVQADKADEFAELYARRMPGRPVRSRDSRLPRRRWCIRRRPHAKGPLNPVSIGTIALTIRTDPDGEHPCFGHEMLADLIVVFHASYVSFVVFGLLAILVGAVLRLELGPKLLVPRRSI